MSVLEKTKEINKRYGKIAFRADKYIKATSAERYKVFTKEWLLVNGVSLIIDGIDTSDLTLEELDKMRNYKTLEIVQSGKKHGGKYTSRKPIPNNTRHEKGISKDCTYYQIGITCGPSGHRITKGIPLHRIVYCWFNGCILPYNEKGEKMDICHKDHNWQNCHISNLVWDTHKNNLAERTGAINQYGLKKNERAK